MGDKCIPFTYALGNFIDTIVLQNSWPTTFGHNFPQIGHHHAEYQTFIGHLG